MCCGRRSAEKLRKSVCLGQDTRVAPGLPQYMSYLANEFATRASTELKRANTELTRRNQAVSGKGKPS